MKTILAALTVALLAAQDPKPIKPAELKESGGVKITVKWEGDVPKLRDYDVSSDAYLKDKHKDGKIPNETVIVNSNATLRNVYVRVSKGLEKYSFATPKAEAVVSIQRGRYVPHVIGVMTGQRVVFVNEDAQCYSLNHRAAANPEFAAHVDVKEKHAENFKSEEIMGRIVDHVHDWMGLWLCVSAHPYFGWSNEDGVVTIEKLPPGKYTLEAVHEKYGKKTADVTIENGKTAEVKFAFSAKD